MMLKQLRKRIAEFIYPEVFIHREILKLDLAESKLDLLAARATAALAATLYFRETL